MPSQSEVEQNSVILTCAILPGSPMKACRLLIIELDPIGTSKSWTSSFCKVILNKSASPCTASYAPGLHGNTRRSCQQCVFLADHLSTLLFETYSFAKVNVLVEKSFQCRRSHRIKRTEVGEICSAYNRSRCHMFVNWLCHPNVFDPVHCEMTICCFRTNFSLEVDFPALKFHRVRKFHQKQFRNRKSRISNHTTQD